MSTALLTLADLGIAPAFGGMMIAFVILGILATVFWLWMLIDAITKEPSGTEKVVWVLVIVFLHFLGALIYFIVRRSGRDDTRLT